jgi:carboxylesterase 2
MVSMLASPLLLISLFVFNPCQANGPPGHGNGHGNGHGHNNNNDLVVQTDKGKVRGMEFDLDTSVPRPDKVYTKAQAFLSIPFAKPPVGNLRLEMPQAAQSWAGVRNCTVLQHKPCLQPLISPEVPSVEDCLYLNVMRPARRNNHKKLPVLVWIHGGGWLMGGNQIDGYEYISNNFVSRGVVLVQIQYRMGVVGFITDNSTQLPGNLGLWDQRQALLWVQNNIEAFGGDKDQVTIWGMSAGSASISYLTLSKHTQNLFNQVIQQSGTTKGSWARNEMVVNHSLTYSVQLGCDPTQGSNALKQCLKNVPVSKIQELLDTFHFMDEEYPMILPFNPHFDNHFLHSPSFNTMLSTAPKKRSVLGITTDELSVVTFLYTDNPTVESKSLFPWGYWNNTAMVYPDKWTTFNRTDFEKLVDEHVRSNGMPEATIQALRNELVEYYLGVEGEGPEHNASETMRLYTALWSDWIMNAPMIWEARAKAGKGWPVYFFHLDQVNEDLASRIPFRALAHGGEYPYTIGPFMFGNFNFTEDDYKVRETMVSGFANFVKSGKPKSYGLDWPRLDYSSNAPLRNIRLVPSPYIDGPTPMTDFARRTQFWDGLKGRYNFKQVHFFPNLD